MRHVKSHRSHTRKILAHIAGRERTTQRDLARELGIALGLTNALLRKLVDRGWIEVVDAKPRGVRYVLTPAGVAAQARQTREYLAGTIRHYRSTRDVIRQRLEDLSLEWPHNGHAVPGNGAGGNGACDGPAKTVVFYGAGEVAEIAYASLQCTDLRLVGVVDDDCSKRFLGMPVHSTASLTPTALDGQPFGCVVIMSLSSPHRIKGRLEALGLPPECIFCL